MIESVKGFFWAIGDLLWNGDSMGILQFVVICLGIAAVTMAVLGLYLLVS